MADKRKKTIQGIEVEQVRFGDKWYTPVDERVKIAHTADPKAIRQQAGYHVVSVQIIQIGDRWAYHCMVEYPVGSGIVKPGSDFIDMKDAAGLAKAETSAIGRALGLHGIASEEGIASADEMQRVKREPAPAQRHLQPVRDPNAVADGTTIQALRQTCEDAGVTWKEMVLWLPLHRKKAVNQLTFGGVAQLEQMLRDNPKQFEQEGA